MATKTIEWHEECLKNAANHAKYMQDEAERAARYAKKAREDVERYSRQIERAKRLGKTKFDADKFGDGTKTERA